MKIYKKLIQIMLAVMLVFTSLIPTALSYQEAVTETQTNTYSIGNAAVAMHILNVSTDEDQASKDDLIYPDSFIPFTPFIQNTGNMNEWVITAVKIPSCCNRVGATDGDEYGNTYTTDMFASDVYYPLFTTVTGTTTNDNDSTHKTYDIDRTNYAKTNKYIADGNAKYTEENVLNNGLLCNDNWTRLSIDSSFAHSEDGFYIVYFGYNKPVYSNESVVPFKGLVAADFCSHDKDYNKIENINEYDENNSVELKVFAVQSDENSDDLTAAFNRCIDTFGVFGTNSVIVNSVENEVNENDEINLTLYTSKDITEIMIKNEDALTDNTNIIKLDASNCVEGDKLNKVNIKLKCTESGNYNIYSHNEQDVDNSGTAKYVKPVYMGKITVK